MAASTGFQFSFGPSGTPREPEEPMRLLVMGDFSGKPAAERAPFAQRPSLRVDIDNLDATIAKLAPRVTTPDAGTIGFRTLDDFHPDHLFANVELFRTLREARSRPAPTGADSPLTALLGGGPASVAPAAGSPSKDPLDAFLRRIVAPHIVPDTRAQDQAYRDAVDMAVAEQMRTILHSPTFQTMEAAWRSVQFLVSGLELDETLQLCILDVSRDEIAAEIAALTDGDVRKSGLFGAIAGKRTQPGGQGWSAVIGLYRFGSDEADVRQLAALGSIASHAGGPFLAAANPADIGAGDATWKALRQSSAARWIGLVAPRLLLRRPYGKRNEPIEGFAFEELGNTPDHEQYLWAPGSVACALLLGRSYRLNEGWSFSPGDERQIEDLPSCTRTAADGETELVPCAEAFLADEQADALIGIGLMPLRSHRHRNVALLQRFQSIADPAAPLSGLPE